MQFLLCLGHSRLMTMSPLYSCGKPCSRGTHNETMKNLALFSSIINGIMKYHALESPSRGSVFNASIESKILSHLHLNNNNSQISQSDWYWRISLLPIFGKILEKLRYGSLYSHLVSCKLLNPNQSGFRPDDL